VRLIQIGVEDPEPRQWVIDCFAIDPTPVLDQAWKTARRPYVKFDQETVIHYAWFEQEWLGYHYGVHLGKIFDTCAISRKVNSKLPPEEKLANAKLMTVALSYLGVEMDKGPQSSDWSVEELSEEQILYAALDAAVLLDLVPPMKKRIVDLGLESECNSQMQKFWNVSNYLGRKYSQISKGELDSLEMQLHGSQDFETSSQLAREIGRSRLHHADRVKASKVILAKQDEHLRAGRHTNYDPRLVEDDDYPF
jgi:ribonuclease D